MLYITMYIVYNTYNKEIKGRSKMIKLIKKETEFMKDLSYELDVYEDELKEDGHVLIDLYSGSYAKKGFDYDVIVRIYSDEDDEAVSLEYFSYTTEDQKMADRLIEQVWNLLESKNIGFEVIFS